MVWDGDGDQSSTVGEDGTKHDHLCMEVTKAENREMNWVGRVGIDEVHC